MVGPYNSLQVNPALVTEGTGMDQTLSFPRYVCTTAKFIQSEMTPLTSSLQQPDGPDNHRRSPSEQQLDIFFFFTRGGDKRKRGEAISDMSRGQE